VQLVQAKRPGELGQDPGPMRRQVELRDLPAQAVVDEALRQRQQEIAGHRGQGALDIEAIGEDAVEDGGAHALVVVGLGRHGQRPRAEVPAARAAGLVLRIVDVEVGDLAVGQGADTTVEGALAAAEFATAGAGVAQASAADDAHEHGLCSWGTGVTYRCSRTQALSFKPPSVYAAIRPATRWG